MTTFSASPSRPTTARWKGASPGWKHELREYRHLPDVLMRALLDKGVLTAEMVEQPARLPRRPRRLERCPHRRPRLDRSRL